MTSAVADDPFPQIWQSLTADRLASLLSPLSPKVKNRVVSFDCPNCGESEAWIYEPKDGKGPSLHCNRKNNCGHTVSLWEFVKSQHGGDGKAALAELAGVTGVRMDGQGNAPAFAPQAFPGLEAARFVRARPGPTGRR